MSRSEKTYGLPELPCADVGPCPRSPLTHDLKILPEFFDPVQAGAKTFELRRDDRDYQTGDFLRLREWNRGHWYTGREVTRQITYVLRGGESFGLMGGFCVLALSEVAARNASPQGNSGRNHETPTPRQMVEG